jgi:hypothetical protein
MDEQTMRIEEDAKNEEDTIVRNLRSLLEHALPIAPIMTRIKLFSTD